MDVSSTKLVLDTSSFVAQKGVLTSSVVSNYLRSLFCLHERRRCSERVTKDKHPGHPRHRRRFSEAATATSADPAAKFGTFQPKDAG